MKQNRFLNLILVFVMLASLLAACGEETEFSDEPETVETENVEVENVEVEEGEAEGGEPAAEEPASANEPPGESSGQPGTWLIMLYQNADDEVLEEDIFIDLNEAEIIGSTDQVTIVSQLDRYDGAYDGDGDWTSTKRFFVTQDNDLEVVASEELEDLGELDSGNAETLVEFANWAIETYPAEHYVLILSDHGAGWDGGWNDDDPVEGSAFRMQDIDNALSAIIAQTGIDAFELVGFDACLMGQLEVMSAIAPHARYAVGSEETEPSLGWAYASFLQALNDNPAMNGGELGAAIVSSYIDQDFRIVDDEARRIFADGDYPAEEVAAELIKDTTLSVVDLSVMQDLNAGVNELAVALSNVDQGAVAEARAYAQSYTSVFGDDVPPSYIDLGHFLDLLLDGVDDADVAQAVESVQAALGQAIVAEKHGEDRPASSGLTIYFPNSELYGMTFGDDANLLYSAYIGRFATASLWDDFLTFHYTEDSFDASSADLTVLTPVQSAQTDFADAVEESAPASGSQVAGPGAGEITIAPIEISASEIGPDGVVTLATEISGANVGYIYYYVSYYDEESGSYLTADMGFISAEETKEIGGVYYPDWGDENVIPLEFDWEPTLYFMSDGNEENDQFAFFEPETYGVDDDSTTYIVRGVYTFAASGKEIDAIIRFSGDSKIRSIFGFNGEGGSGAPREITPKAGDTFTIVEEWLDFDVNPDGEFVDYLGGTMTFGEQDFEMVAYYAYSGDYVLGIIVEDLNGNRTEEFVYVTVTD